MADKANTTPGLRSAASELLDDRIEDYCTEIFLKEEAPRSVGWDHFLELTEEQQKDGVLEIIDRLWPGDDTEEERFHDFYVDAFEEAHNE